MNPTDTSPDPAATSEAARENGQGASGQSAGARPMEKVRRTAGKAMTQAREKALQSAEGGKDKAAGKLGGYSDRLRASAESFQEEDPNIAHFANRAADRLQEVADYVREADFGRLRQDAANVAHRHPALFMGGMLVAGLVLGNLAKASVQTLREDATDRADGRDDHNSQEYGMPDDSMGAVSDSFDPERRDEPHYGL